MDCAYLVTSMLLVSAAEAKGREVGRNERRTKYYNLGLFSGRTSDWVHIFRTKTKIENKYHLFPKSSTILSF